jgi:hypothetical protein
MRKFLETKIAKTLYIILGLSMIGIAMGYVLKYSKLTATINSPQIYFPESTHDFGKVPQGPQLQYNFKFKNTGAQPLKIERVQTSCGCTGATVGEKTEYLNGESGEISVSFNTQGREGKQEKTIQIFTNEPGSSTTPKTISISCEILPSMMNDNNGNPNTPPTETPPKQLQKVPDNGVETPH